MKLLMVQHHYYPSLGGGQEYAKLLSEGLVKKGHKVTVFTTNSLTNEDILSLSFTPPFLSRKKKIKPLKKRERVGGVSVRRFPVKGRFYSFNSIPEMFSAMEDFSDYDVITSYGFNLLSSFEACRKARKQGKPFILNGVDVLVPKSLPLPARVLKWFYDLSFGRYIAKNSDYIISFTEDQVKDYVKRGAVESKIGIIPPPLILKDYSSKISEAFLKRHGIKKKDKVLLYAGRLTEHKGIQDVIEELPEIRKKVPNVKFFIAGEDYGYKKSLQSLIREKGVEDSVFFVGPYRAREKELIQFFAAADLFVLPSNMEGFGIVLAEAMACGTPCIAYNIPAVREVISDGENGYLAKDRRDLSKHIISLLSSPSELKRMGENGKKSVKRLSQSTVVSDLESIYKKLLKNK
ncbi:MAG: glycosyltransferase family 4 protein [archaeon]|nr:glycosyltransferase family 4 protein [archaeon]